jgi:transcriptional repressor NrdR
MMCPTCQSPSRVLETRREEHGDAVRRRRQCRSCGRRFTTYERRESEPLFVRKRSGERQRFDRVKLRAALLRAAHKRPVDAEAIETIVHRVEAEADRGGGEMPAQRIGELCLSALRELDAGAYLQFAGTLPSPNAEIAVAGLSDSGVGSVRAPRKDPEFTPKAVTRRGLDE